MAELRLRPLVAADQSFLWDIFHVALWDPPPGPLRPRSLLQHPDVRIYAEDWGRAGDVGVVAEVDGRRAGACWMRLLMGGRGARLRRRRDAAARHRALCRVPVLWTAGDA